jgi:hypothetical protein
MEKISLNIVTPCTRPENLNTMQDSILKANEKVNEVFDIMWYIIFDHDGTFYPHSSLKTLYDNPYAFMRPHVLMKDDKVIHGWGNPQRNYALSQIKAGWVHFLDDDTIMPETFLYNLLNAIRDWPGKQAFVFDQCAPDGELLYKASLANLKVDSVGGPQVVFDRALIGETKWEDEPYNADGLFIERIYRNNPLSFQVVDGFIYWNYLRSESVK